MQVSVEKTSELSRKMTVSVPEAVVQEKMAERLKTLARRLRLMVFVQVRYLSRSLKKCMATRCVAKWPGI